MCEDETAEKKNEKIEKKGRRGGGRKERRSEKGEGKRKGEGRRGKGMES